MKGGLGQDAAEGVVGGVGFDDEGKIWLEVLEEGSRCESNLQLAKRITGLVRTILVYYPNTRLSSVIRL